jgi:hypothetical protein
MSDDNTPAGILREFKACVEMMRATPDKIIIQEPAAPAVKPDPVPLHVCLAPVTWEVIDRVWKQVCDLRKP